MIITILLKLLTGFVLFLTGVGCSILIETEQKGIEVPNKDKYIVFTVFIASVIFLCLI